MKQLGLVHIYTGDGKGKTTAALGLAMRARGAGLKVMVAQLFKEASGEAKTLEELGIEHLQFSSKHPLFKKYSEKELEAETEKCRTFVKSVFDKIKNEKYDVAVLDEVGPALKFNLLETKDLLSLIKSKPKNTELIMTGRGFTSEITKTADYVTEMIMIKHPFTQGIHARRGIEY